jgi:hypothetical protein
MASNHWHEQLKRKCHQLTRHDQDAGSQQPVRSSTLQAANGAQPPPAL